MRLAKYQIVVIKCLYALNYGFFPLPCAVPTDLLIPGSADKNSLFKNEFYAFCKDTQIFSLRLEEQEGEGDRSKKTGEV